jgi:hypothetical protein
MHNNRLLYIRYTTVCDERASVLYTLVGKRCSKRLLNSTFGLFICNIKVNSRCTDPSRVSIKFQIPRGAGQKYFFGALRIPG